nr:DUF5615 family PIN-like protein [Psychroflexus montanilacus]
MTLKLLFNQNISFRITKKLSEHFSDCRHVSDCDLQDSDDITIWDYAKKTLTLSLLLMLTSMILA